MKKEDSLIKTTLHIDGMMCSMCEAHINEAIRKHFKIDKVKSSCKKGITEILSREPLAEEELVRAIAETGYILTASKNEPARKKTVFFRRPFE